MDESINIEVVDKVARTIKPEIIGIGEAAQNAYMQIAKLKAELGITSTSALTTATSNFAKAESDVARQTAAAAKALDQQTAAQKRLTSAQRESIAKAAGVATSAPVMGAINTGAGLGAADAAAAAAMAKEARDAETSVASFAATSVPLFTKIKASAASTYDTVKDAFFHVGGQVGSILGSGGAAAVEKDAAAIDKVGKSALGSSLFIRELVTEVREGSRGDFTRMAGTASLLAQSLGLLEVILPVAITGFIGLYAAHKDFNDAVAKSQLKDYANSLGLTEKEMRKFSDTTADASGNLKEVNNIQVTWMDTIKGFGDTFSDLVKQQDLPDIAGFFSNQFDQILAGAKYFASGLYGLIVGSVNAVGVIILELPDVISQAYTNAVNFVASAVEAIVNKTIDAFNALSQGAHTVLAGVGLADPLSEAVSIQHIQLGKMVEQNAGAAQQMGKDIGDGYTDAIAEGDKGLTTFYSKWRTNSVKEAMVREKAIADAIKANRNPTKPKEDRQGDAIAKTIRDLNGQISNLGNVGVPGAISQQMTDITNTLATHKVDLNSAAYANLRKQILGLVTDYQTQKPVYAEVSALYEQGTGALEKYNDTLAATKIAVDKGYISQQQADVVNNKALETLDNALDPLRQYNKAISDQNDLLQYYGRNLTIQTKAQQLFNSAVSAGAAKSTDSIQPYVQQAKSQLDAQDMQSAKGNISNNSFEEQNRQLQVQIDAYKQLGITTSEAANNVRDLVTSQKELAVQAGKGSWSDVAETSVTKLISGFKNVKSSVLDLSSTFLNDFSNGIANSIGAAIAGTQSLGDSLRQLGQTLISEVIAALIKMGIQWALNATIGRALSAAAVAGTTAEAVATAAAWAPAAALASLATLGTNSAPAAAALATTTALAEGTALLGAVGFATGGYTGNMAASAIAGVVHGQEYVFDAAATNRIGVGNLEAMRNGRLNPAPANDNRGPSVVIKPEPGVYVEPQQTPDGHIEMIARRVSSQDFGKNMQSELGNPNTKSSKAMNSAYKVRRNR